MIDTDGRINLLNRGPQYFRAPFRYEAESSSSNSPLDYPTTLLLLLAGGAL